MIQNLLKIFVLDSQRKKSQSLPGRPPFDAMMSRAAHLLFFLFLALGRGENVVDYSCKATKQPPLHPYSLLMTVWIISRPSFPPSTLAPSLGADDCLVPNQDPCSFLAAGGCGSSCSEGVVAYIFESGPCNPNSTNSSNDLTQLPTNVPAPLPTYAPMPLPTSEPTALLRLPAR